MYTTGDIYKEEGVMHHTEEGFLIRPREYLQKKPPNDSFWIRCHKSQNLCLEKEASVYIYVYIYLKMP